MQKNVGLFLSFFQDSVRMFQYHLNLLFELILILSLEVTEEINKILTDLKWGVTIIFKTELIDKQ